MKVANSTYLVEYYVKSPEGVAGWDIKLARAVAASSKEACAKVREAHPFSFDCIITCEEVAPDFLPRCECLLLS